MAYSRITVTLTSGSATSGSLTDKLCACEGDQVLMSDLEQGDKVLFMESEGEVDTVTRHDMDDDGTITSTTQLSPVV